MFIDGAHSFPYPSVDWCYLSRRLRVGGLLLLDDVPIPAVAVVYDAMASDPAWEKLEVADGRAVLFRKLAQEPDGDYWRVQAFNRSGPDYSFLPWSQRLRLGGADRARDLLHAADRRAPSVGRAARSVAKRVRRR